MVARRNQLTLAELRTRLGQELGVSSWTTVSQKAVNDFARATGDDSWIHVDVERARATPFGGTIAHGFLTLSLAGGLLAEVFEVEGASHELNYGVDRLRFPAPLPVGDSVRMRVTLEDMQEEGRTATLKLGLTFETRAGGKPVCVATWIVREFLEDDAGDPS